MSAKTLLFAAAAALGLGAAQAQAQAQTAPVPAGGAEASPAVSAVVVTARRLDAARQAIEPALGATSYVLPEAFITNLPGGANTELNQVVLQAPGVAQDSFGQLHIRGEHGDVQYRLNNVILPEGLAVFGQTLSPRLASSIQLITGALPAQYGLRTAGIINITTKSGMRPGGEASLYGGSHDVFTPSVEYGGTWGPNSGFASFQYTRTGVGIEGPDPRPVPLHDLSNQLQGFGYFDHILNESSRVSLILGTSQQSFEIPNIGGLQPALGLTVNGVSQYPSEQLDETQREGTTYAIASYLHTTDAFTGQASVFARYSTLRFSPDVLGDLLYNGLAQEARKSDISLGLQLEGVYTLNASHTVRAGAVLQTDRTRSETVAQALPVNAAGAQTSDQPITVADAGHMMGETYSVFLQDEWKLTDALTLNYGLRFDQANAFVRENQLSPRANLVWRPSSGTTVHLGYARYFSPPPFELVASETIARFEGTTAQAPGTLNDLPRAERSNYYDAGVEQKLGAFTLGVDIYDKQSRNLLDEGQFGAPIILTPFNYAEGYSRGVEFSGNYAHGPFTAYANLAISRAEGRGIVSSQFNFAPDELAYIDTHFIHLDHDQTYTASAGGTYRLGANRFSADLIYGSGMRSTPPGEPPNSAHLPGYAQVNVGLAHDFESLPCGPITVRADVINLFDKVYQIRNGSGVGVGAPQYGPRRGVFVGVSKSF